MSRLLYMLIVLFGAHSAMAQNQKMNWYFGIGAAIGFETGKPKVLTDNQLKRYATYSITANDPKTGKLLFYCNGYDLIDGSQNLVKTDLNTSTAIIFDILVLQDPQDENGYYLFMVVHSNINPSQPYIKYYKVQVNGNVVTCDADPTYYKTGSFQTLTAVKSCLENDWWLLTVNIGSQELWAMKIGSTLAENVLVRSPLPIPVRSVGDLVTNENGTLISISEYAPDGDGSQVLLMDFDKNCGKATTREVYNYPGGEYAFGLSFSINNQFLYCAYSVGASELVQFDIVANTYQLIASDKSNFNGMQMGPDGVIYISTHEDGIPGPRIAAILKPNNKGAACNFNINYLQLGSGRTSNFNFPNFIQDYSKESCFEFKPDFVIDNACAGSEIDIKKKRDFIIPDTFFWDDNGKIYSELLPKLSFPRPGDYPLSFVRKVCGSNDTIEYNVNVRKKPSVDLGKDTSICIGSSLQLDGRSGSKADYFWNGQPSNDSFLIVDKEGIYWVEANANGCRDMDTITVGYKSPIWLDLGGEHYLCEERDEVVLLDAGKGFDRYYWLPTGDSSQWIIAEKVDTYFVIVEDFRGCHGEDSTIVDRRCEPYLWFPNAFTPNGDGTNEQFKPIGQDIIGYELTIYNRWGEWLFTSTNLFQGWDGKFKGIPCSSDTYFYTCSYQGWLNLKHKTERRVNGFIQLLR